MNGSLRLVSREPQTLVQLLRESLSDPDHERCKRAPARQRPVPIARRVIAGAVSAAWSEDVEQRRTPLGSFDQALGGS
jgi:hypothetical protein